MCRPFPNFFTCSHPFPFKSNSQGASNIKRDDSLKVMLGRIDAYLSGDTSIGPSGRYQLQSFSIDRTHWHYLLDTTTGELYRMEPSRTPANARWVLSAKPNFKK